MIAFNNDHTSTDERFLSAFYCHEQSQPLQVETCPRREENVDDVFAHVQLTSLHNILLASFSRSYKFDNKIVAFINSPKWNANTGLYLAAYTCGGFAHRYFVQLYETMKQISAGSDANCREILFDRDATHWFVIALWGENDRLKAR